MKTTSSHFLVLDGARGLAAIAVLLYHLAPYFLDTSPFSGSYLSVDLFFIMSGFVVARAYENRILDGAMSFWEFTRVRLIRLYPLYLAACAIGIGYELVKIAMSVDDAISVSSILLALPATLLMLPDILSATPGMSLFPFAPAAWSLSLEFWMNLVFAAVVVKMSTRWIWALTLLSLIAFAYSVIHWASFDLGMRLQTLPAGTARFWFSFLVGMLIYRHRVQLGSGRSLALLLLPVTFAYVAFDHDALWLQAVWVAIVFPVFVSATAHVPLPKAAALVCDHLGRLSYGLYILHTPLFLVAMGAVKTLVGPAWEDNKLVYGIGIVAFIFAATAVLTYLFEEPVRRSLRRRRGTFRKRLDLDA